MKHFVHGTLFSCLSLLVLMPGCKKSNMRPQRPAYAQELNEAKLHDVSLPVGVKAYDMTQHDEIEKQGAETIAFYETDFSETMLREFYQMDMERLGWKEVETFVSVEESLLLYETPRKIAAISIRPHTGCIVASQMSQKAHDKRGVFIFVGQRSS